MRKITLTLLGLTAIMSLTGCGASKSATSGNKAEEKYMVPPTDLIVNQKAVSLMVGETFQIKTQIRPLAAYDDKLTYQSSDKKVASVDKKGVVKAVKGGHCLVSVFASNYVDERETPNLVETIEVYVYKKGTTTTKASDLNEMKRYQQQHCQLPDSVRMYDYRVYDLVCEGKSQDRSEEYQTYVVSQSEGLMSYDSQEVYINVTDGGKSYDEYGYTCHTRDSYASYMYHRKSSVKNVFYIATEFNKGKQSRYDTMCNILDSFFSVQNDYFTGALEDSLSTDWFSKMSRYTRLVKKFGSFRTNSEFGITYTLIQSYDDVTSIEDEVRYATQLPAGIKTINNESLSFTWVNGYMVNYEVISNMTFEWQGKDYEYNVSLAQRIDVISQAEVAKYIPDNSEYNNVDYYYDI